MLYDDNLYVVFSTSITDVSIRVYVFSVVLSYMFLPQSTRHAETPMHYVVKCPKFAVQRELYFSELRRIYPDMINNLDDHRWKHKLVHDIVHGDEELYKLESEPKHDECNNVNIMTLNGSKAF